MLLQIMEDKSTMPEAIISITHHINCPKHTEICDTIEISPARDSVSNGDGENNSSGTATVVSGSTKYDGRFVGGAS